MSGWLRYHGTGEPQDDALERPLPEPPPWRVFDGQPLISQAFDAPEEDRLRRGAAYQAGPADVERVNAALYLRRPLLITGKPGTGKSTLAYHVARELRLGPVLRWPITSRSVLQDGLYHYDAIGRLQEASLRANHDTAGGGESDIGHYVRLGPLGTALLPSARPRILLIDELDKSDIDLPNDLLNVFEEGEFEIPELRRLADMREPVRVMTADGDVRVSVSHGRIRCHAFPVVVLTSNGEREFPPAFLRRCLPHHTAEPDAAKLKSIVKAHLGAPAAEHGSDLIDRFLTRRDHDELATDQLLNAVYLLYSGLRPPEETPEHLAKALFPHLGPSAG